MNPLENVTVIVPTLNANGALLQDHVVGLNRWVANARAVIVVDSESTDGTVEYILENLEHPQINFFERPKGLYRAWNYAIEKVETEYLYIATVGDVIEPDGVRCLVELLESHNGDIAISPPRYLLEDGGERSNFQWPVDLAVERLGDGRSRLLDPKFVSTIHTLEFPATLAGSAASNLYRTDYLQKHPFPLKYGNQGDSAWAVRASVEARWCLYPKPLAGLVFHPRQSQAGSSRKALSSRRALFENLLVTIKVDSRWKEWVQGSPLRNFLEALSAEAEARTVWLELRSRRWPWFLSGKAWSAQRVRKHSAALCAERKREALDWFIARFGSSN